MQFSIEDGVRHSTAAAYIRPVEGNADLDVVTGAVARRLLFDGTRCIGRRVVARASASSARTRSSVVVCGGTIGSAQLLLLSGIGPADHLRSHGIDVVADLPGVGENLHDHLLSPVIFSAEREVGPPSPGLPACQTHLFWRSRPGLPAPDLQPIHFMVPMVRALDGGDRERLHLDGRARAPAQPRLTAPHRSERPKIRSRSTRTSSHAKPTSRASSRPSTCAGGRRGGRAPRLGRGREVSRPVGRHGGGRARVRARDRDHLPPSGRDVQDGHRCGRRRRPPAPRARHRGPAGRRRIDHADGDDREHECSVDHDRRTCRGVPPCRC